MLTKAQADRRDPYLALLDYRNSPISGLCYSPAQMLMSRRLRSKVPAAPQLLVPSVVDAHPSLRKIQQRQKQYYDRGTKPLPPLKQGDGVWHKQGNQRKKATVIQWCPEPRSHWIQTERSVLHRNRQHLQKSPRNTNKGYTHLFDDEEDVEASSSTNQQLPVPVSAENCTTTQAGCRHASPPPDLKRY